MATFPPDSEAVLDFWFKASRDHRARPVFPQPPPQQFHFAPTDTSSKDYGTETCVRR